jgi:hypothetical protein
MYDVHGTLLKENIQMTGACFADGTVQDLYFPSHAEKHAGKFKGMELLLEERRKKGDLGDMSEAELKKKNAECKSFKCTDPQSTTCCMRRMLFNQPDFSAVKSCLEDTCSEHKCTVLFLPKGGSKRIPSQKGYVTVTSRGATVNVCPLPYCDIQLLRRRPESE